MLYEAAYPPLLQGVSQQHQDLRKPGQVTDMLNMLCDPVTGLRRRPGAVYVRDLPAPNNAQPSLYTEPLEIGGNRAILMLDTQTGVLELRNPTNYDVITSYPADPYLRGSPEDIRTAFVGDSLWVANIKQRPTLERGLGNTPRLGSAGFAYIPAGAFGRDFNLSVADGVRGATATYTTPNGQGTNDAQAASPENIAKRLADAIRPVVSQLHVIQQGPYIFFSAGSGSSGDIIVRSESGSNSVTVSGNSRVTSASQLPASLPRQADNIVMAVGQGRAPQYYRYNAVGQAWLETGRPGGVTRIANVPRRVYLDPDGRWFIESPYFEGRLAGDDDSNPEFQWLTKGITGMCAYQGRLCFLSGNYVAFSASGNPRRWFRSTVTELLDSDPIEVGASSQSSASYSWGVQYQRDLVLFAAQHQAVVPNNGAAITPRTATVVPTSAYGVDTNVTPRSLGKTLMYPRSVAPGYTGFMELMPSPYTESQYTSEDNTPHLPRYFPGRVRSWAISNAIPMAAVVLDAHPLQVRVYEYSWDGDERVQSAWHTWTFPYPVEAVHFVDGRLHLIFRGVGVRVVGSIDPRGSSDVLRNTYPFLDLHFQTQLIRGNTFHLPSWAIRLGGTSISVWSGVYADTSDRNWGMPIPLDDQGRYEDGDLDAFVVQAYMGITYPSHVVPPRPIILDDGGNVVHCRTSTVLRYKLHLHRSYLQHVTFYRGIPAQEPSVLFKAPVYAPVWDGWNLALGRSWVQPEVYCIVPARVKTDDHYIKIESEGVYELNILGLDFTIQYSPKIHRR